MVMILWHSRSTYLQLFPDLIKGKGGTFLFANTPGSQQHVGRRSLKAVEEGHPETILVEFFGFNP